MKTMSRVLWWLCMAAILIVAVALMPKLHAEENAGEKPGLVISDKAVLTATVEDIDYNTRMVTLKGPKGRTITMKVGEDVKNLNQVKKGDQVVAEYLESVAVFVRKAEAEPSETEFSAVEVAPPGTKTGKVMVKTRETTARIEMIDYKNRLVTLRTADEKPVTMHVDESAKKFDQVKRGDEVVVRYTETVAVSVKKP